MVDLGTYKDRFDESGQRILKYAAEESLRRAQHYLVVEHILDAITILEPELFNSTMRGLSLDPRSVKTLIEERLEDSRHNDPNKGIRISPEAVELFKLAIERARGQGRKTIAATDLFMAFTQDEQRVLINILAHFGVTAENVVEQVSAQVRAFETAQEPERPARQKPRIFLSYRRDDSAGHAGRLSDRLSQHFGEHQLFVDIDTIEPGEDFIEVIEQAVRCCEVLIAVIGKTWLSITDGLGRRRLDNPEDYVRVELATALARNIRVIPVLVQGAVMPHSEELPDVLAKLARRNAFELSDARWAYDVERLIRAVEKVVITPKSP